MANPRGQYAFQASRRNILQAGSYRFTRQDVALITQLYDRESWSLWNIKDMYFVDATLQQLAVAIVQGRFDGDNVLFSNRPRFTFLPSHIDLETLMLVFAPNGMIYPNKNAFSFNK